MAGQDSLFEPGGAASWASDRRSNRPLGGDPGFGDHTFSVDQLSAALQDAFTVLFPDEIWVEGEIAAISAGRTRNGLDGARHVYFNLVVPESTTTAPRSDASLPVVLFDANRRRVNDVLKRHGSVKMTEGVRVRIRGRLDFYPAQSKVQLRMTGIDPVFTIGVLQSERDRILALLLADGLLDRNRSLPVPPVPRTVGLVTSKGSAAEADFLHELEASGLAWTVVAVDAPMQGVDAPHRICGSLLHLASLELDLIALVRGGGARTDLACFDHERVARTIADLPVPVFTGIGHEIDTVVADAVASSASKTPTACASAIIDRARAWTRRATLAGDRLPVAAARAIAIAGQHHSQIGNRLAASAGSRLVADAAALDHAAASLRRAPVHALEREHRRLDAAGTTTRAFDPQRILERGFAIVRRADDGSPVRSPDDAPAGVVLRVTTAGGDLDVSANGPAAEATDLR